MSIYRINTQVPSVIGYSVTEVQFYIIRIIDIANSCQNATKGSFIWVMFAKKLFKYRFKWALTPINKCGPFLIYAKGIWRDVMCLLSRHNMILLYMYITISRLRVTMWCHVILSIRDCICIFFMYIIISFYLS